MNIGPSNTFSTILTAMVSTSRQDAATRRDKARMKSAGEALETLKQKRSTTSEDAKAVAREKVERLKARIRMLQMMATTDPKGTARLAAQLARELGAAVKAYAAAGGSTAGMSSTTSALPAADGQTTDGQAVADPVANADLAADPATAAIAELPATAEGDEAETTAGANEKAEVEARQNPYQKAIDAAQADLAERSRNAGERRADSEFMAEAKRLANELKSAMRRAAEALKRNAEADAPERDEADQAIRAVEREIESHAQHSPDATAGIGLSITV